MIAVKRELRLGIALLLASQLVIALGAIGLLSRLVPAIDRILEDNVYSIEAAEQMLSELARYGGGEPLGTELYEALERAQANVTEPAERQILLEIELRVNELAAGDPLAYESTLLAIERFIDVNRGGMRRTRDEASRLSEAGAWAASLLAAVVFSAGTFIAVRLERRIVEPLGELFAVAQAATGGDVYRRCKLQRAPGGLRQLMEIVNELLDERFAVERHDDSAAS